MSVDMHLAPLRWNRAELWPLGPFFPGQPWRLLYLDVQPSLNPQAFNASTAR